MPLVALGQTSTLGLLFRLRVGFEGALGGWRRGAKETFLLLVVAIPQLSVQLAVFVQELVDSTLLFQTVLANGVRLHPGWRSAAEKAGATASHRYCRASRRRG